MAEQEPQLIANRAINRNLITGQMSLGSFLEAIENKIGSHVTVLMSGNLCFYHRGVEPHSPVDLNTPIEEAVEMRERSEAARREANVVLRRIPPPLAERQNDIIIFMAYDDRHFPCPIKWHP